MFNYYLYTGILFIATLIASVFIGHFIVISLIYMVGHKKQADKIGKWIGYVERSLISIFVFLGLTSVTVFIFATKAAVIGFRIRKDTSPEEQKEFAEYMLLGTMISYSVALIIGLVGKALRSFI